jgi:hypothetical protein|tara:strand:+ start:86 stop:283 length:198 start_codon:yes stop_codon:yes gene_type:complete
MSKYIREEEDGSKTISHAEDCGGGVIKLHNNKGPALVNTQQKIKDYYLYGVKLTKEEWEKKSKFS